MLNQQGLGAERKATFLVTALSANSNEKKQNEIDSIEFNGCPTSKTRYRITGTGPPASLHFVHEAFRAGFFFFK